MILCQSQKKAECCKGKSPDTIPNQYVHWNMNSGSADKNCDFAFSVQSSSIKKQIKRTMMVCILY